MKQVNIQFPLRMLGLLLGLFLSVGAFAQIDVKGHVKDATGEPIIGATVRVASSQAATITDFDGNFVLKANQGDNITISYIGYQTATVKCDGEVVGYLGKVAYEVAEKYDLRTAAFIAELDLKLLTKYYSNTPSFKPVSKFSDGAFISTRIGMTHFSLLVLWKYFSLSA